MVCFLLEKKIKKNKHQPPISTWKTSGKVPVFLGNNCGCFRGKVDGKITAASCEITPLTPFVPFFDKAIYRGKNGSPFTTIPKIVCGGPPWRTDTKVETLLIFFLNHHPVDGSEVRRENHLGCTKPCTVNSGINYQPQLVPDFFHQLYHHGRLRPHFLGEPWHGGRGLPLHKSMYRP